MRQGLGEGREQPDPLAHLPVVHGIDGDLPLLNLDELGLEGRWSVLWLGGEEPAVRFIELGQHGSDERQALEQRALPVVIEPCSRELHHHFRGDISNDHDL